jgi:KUP system potassium uptake protein
MPVSEATTQSDEEPSEEHGGNSSTKPALVLGAVGIVFGDIGTSPIYALRETFIERHEILPTPLNVYGVLSLVFWSMMIIVTLKYVMIVMRADNKGEGGGLALLALIKGKLPEARWAPLIVMLGVFATALFYGDAMITPAISVLSATEGLSYVNPGFKSWILPISLFILIGLFAIQARGTAMVGALFGPIMVVYFVTIGGLGVFQLVKDPTIIFYTLNPLSAVDYFVANQFKAFVAMGGVVLAVTGAEALYADMGHFGRKPISYAWLYFVFPALMLNYMGQGAMILDLDRAAALEAVKDPFFIMAPDFMRLPVVIIAIFATIIASQAVISGAFSLTQQAVQLGFLPRMRILHTSESAAGQIYIPVINWALMVAVILLVFGFRSSTNLAAAYGVAVTGTMVVTTSLMVVVLLKLWKWPLWRAGPILALFFVVDFAYFGSNLLKVPDGGYFPLIIGFVIFVMLTTWAKGRSLMMERMAEAAMPIKVFIDSAASSATRVKGTAVFMTSSAAGVPHALLHNLKHNKVLHERVILLTVKIANMPFVEGGNRCKMEDLGNGFHRLILKYGFMEEPNVPAALQDVTSCGPAFKMMDTSFFLARQTLLPSSRPGMAIWREHLFSWMLRNAESAMEFFRLPTNRVVELGSQVEI